jgi:hypothetical protein
MGIVRWLFGADATAPPDAMKLDATTEAVLARALSALLPDASGDGSRLPMRATCSPLRAHNTRSEKPTRTAEKTSSRTRRVAGQRRAELAYVYYEEEPGRRIAVNFAKLAELLRKG